MEYRDLLKDEIEQVLKVMAKILSDVMGISSNGQYSATIEASTQQLKNELDIDVEQILQFSYESLLEYVNILKLSERQIDTLADILLGMGNCQIEKDNERANLYFEKSINLLNISDEISKTISLTRADKIIAINKLKS